MSQEAADTPQQTERRDVRQHSRWRRLREDLAGRTKDILSIKVLLILLVVAVAFWYVFRDSGQTYYFDAISVPKELQDQGITAAYLTARISEKLTSIERSVANASPKDSILLSKDEAEPPEIEIPATHVSLRTVTRELQRWMKREPTRINAEVVVPGAATLSSDGKGRGTGEPLELTFLILRAEGPLVGARVRVDGSDVDGLIDASALAILKVINPYLHLCLYGRSC